MSKRVPAPSNTIVLKRNVIRNRINLTTTEKEPQVTQIDDELVATRNKMLHHISKECDGQPMIIVNKNRAIEKQVQKPILNENLPTELLLIPIDDRNNNAMRRDQTTKYLVNYPGCTHFSIHSYAAFNKKRLIEDSIKFITLPQYGTDYPIVPISNLVRCQICIPNDHDLLTISEPRGSINFYCTKNFNEDTSHVVVPSHVNDKLPMYKDGDILWVNMSHRDIEVKNVTEIRDIIIATTGRKNYKQVFVLAYPYQERTCQFEDFGTLVYLTTANDGYNDKGFIISTDVYEDEDPYSSSSEDEAPKITRVDIKSQTAVGLDKIDCVQSDPNIDNVDLTPALNIIDNSVDLQNEDKTTDVSGLNNKLEESSDDITPFPFDEPKPQRPKAITNNDENIGDISLDNQTDLMSTTKIEEVIDQSIKQQCKLDLDEFNDRIILRFPLSTKEDFMHNHNYFVKKGLQASFISYVDKLTITVISCTEKILLALYDDIISMGYVITDCKPTTVLHELNVLDATTFTIHSAPPQSYTTESINSNDSSSDEYENERQFDSSIDEMISSILSTDPDPYVTPISLLLEKAYFKLRSKRNLPSIDQKIYFHFTSMQECVGIRSVDYKAYEKTPTYNIFQHGMDEDKKTMLSLLMNLKYTSDIPISKIIPDDDGVTILLN